MTSEPASKRQKTEPAYELIYWPSIPGRGEFIRLCFEATSTPYRDVTNEGNGDIGPIFEYLQKGHVGATRNPVPLAPPILKHGDLVLSQTPNILLYLAPRLGLAGQSESLETKNKEGDDAAIYKIHQLALTALDGLSNEVHDTHHPIAVGLNYEEQKEEAARRAKDYRENRLPKFLEYFNRVLSAESSMKSKTDHESDENTWLYGSCMSYADLVLFQCIDGLLYAFPNAMASLQKKGSINRVMTLYNTIKNASPIKDYLESPRRMKYANGIYRHYPELDPKV